MKQVPGTSPGSKGGLCVDLITLPPPCAHCLDILAASTSYSPRGLSRPSQGYLYFIMSMFFCSACDTTNNGHKFSPETINSHRFTQIHTVQHFLNTCLVTRGPVPFIQQDSASKQTNNSTHFSQIPFVD